MNLRIMHLQTQRILTSKKNDKDYSYNFWVKKLQRLTIVSDTFQWIYSDEKQEPLSNTYTILIGPNNFEFSKQFDFCNSV